MDDSDERPPSRHPLYADDGSPFGREALREWFLIGGNRFVLAGLMTLFFVAVLLLFQAVGLAFGPNVQPMYYALSALIGGNVTLITVVVSINQLLLSRHMEPPGQIRTQMREAVEYRDEVEESAGTLAPAEPEGFLEVLFTDLAEQLTAVGSLNASANEGKSAEELDEVTADLLRHAERVSRLLDESHDTLFEALSLTLTTSYSHQTHEFRRIHRRYGDQLPDGMSEHLHAVLDRLRSIDTARHYFRNLYLQDELSSFSRHLVYAGLPAVALSLVTLVSLSVLPEPQSVDRAIIGMMFLGVTAGVFPAAMLFSFVIRTSTVAQRTITTVPFTISSEEQ